MKINTLITSYWRDDDNCNPLIRAHLITTDDSKAKANFESMVAHEMASANWYPYRNDGTQTTLVRERESGATEYLTIKLDFTTMPLEMTAGRPNW